jgi:hypothetical protein
MCQHMGASPDHPPHPKPSQTTPKPNPKPQIPNITKITKSKIHLGREPLGVLLRLRQEHAQQIPAPRE